MSKKTNFHMYEGFLAFYYGSAPVSERVTKARHGVLRTKKQAGTINSNEEKALKELDKLLGRES